MASKYQIVLVVDAKFSCSCRRVLLEIDEQVKVNERSVGNDFIEKRHLFTCPERTIWPIMRKLVMPDSRASKYQGYLLDAGVYRTI